MPIFAGYSKLQVLLVLGYFSIWLYTFSCVANPFTDPRRSGWIVIFQLPFLFMFSAKNNILGWLVGFGYQSLNYLHRYVGQLVILAANVHAIGYVYDYFSRGIVFARLQRASNIFGLTALGCFNIIFIFSTSFWRKKAYNVFAKIHILGFVTAVPAIYFHRPSTLPFIIAVCAVYYLNLVLRLAKTRIVTATIRPLSSFSATRIEIPRLNSGWHAGQHVRVRILSMQFGRLGWSESHPFTIASAPVAAGSAVGDETLTLICKKTGTWTAKLFELAKEGSDLESGGADIGKTIKIMIEGPYGGPEQTMFSSFSAIVIVAGGSGVTFALSAAQSLVHELRHQSCSKIIELVWMVQDRDAASSLVPLFAALTESCPYLTVSIYCTREQPNAIMPEKLEWKQITFYAGRPGRVGLTRTLDNAITRLLCVNGDARESTGDERTGGMLVGICGPVGLGEEVRSVVDGIPIERQKRVGGVQIHEEVFNW